MSKICMSNCVSDARVPARATYVNLHKWPGSDAEFVNSAATRGRERLHRHGMVVDSISCRQMYLNSYTFSRKETVPEKTMKCLGKVRDRVVAGRKETAQIPQRRRLRRRRRCRLVRRVKEFSGSALLAIFRRLLLCTTTVDDVGV